MAFQVVWAETLEELAENKVYKERLKTPDDYSKTREKARNTESQSPLDIVKSLVEQGADIESRDNEYGATILTIASGLGDLESVKYLISKGANVNATSKRNGETALLLASGNGHLEMVKILVENGAKINAKDDNGFTALMVASIAGYTDIAKYLISKNADLNMKDKKYGATALMYASGKGNLEIVRALVEARDTFLFFFTVRKVNINAKNKQGATALDMAGSDAIVALLRSNGAKFPLER